MGNAGFLFPFLLFLILVVVAGCTGPEIANLGFVCNEPYIKAGASCCLDQNSNRICDRDEKQEMPPAGMVVNIPEPAKNSCANKCVGATLYSKGVLYKGECDYANADVNSVACGYVPPEPQPAAIAKDPPIIQIAEMACRYQYNSSFLLHIKSVSKTPIPIGSRIKLLFDDGSTASFTIDKGYSNGQRVWQDIIRDTGWEQPGREFTIDGINSSFINRKNLGYAYIYCPPDQPLQLCNKSNGIVLYEGRALEDCGTDRITTPYFTPYKSIIELAKTQSVQATDEIREMARVSINKDDVNGLAISLRDSGFQTNPLYYADMNKEKAAQYVQSGWLGNYKATFQRKTLDGRTGMVLPYEQVSVNITKFTDEGTQYAKEAAAQNSNEEMALYRNRARIIREYEDNGFKETVLTRIDSNSVKGADIFYFSTISPGQTIANGMYSTVKIDFLAGNYYVVITDEGYGDIVAPRRVDQLSGIVAGRIRALN